MGLAHMPCCAKGGAQRHKVKEDLNISFESGNFRQQPGYTASAGAMIFLPVAAAEAVYLYSLNF